MMTLLRVVLLVPLALIAVCVALFCFFFEVDSDLATSALMLASVLLWPMIGCVFLLILVQAIAAAAAFAGNVLRIDTASQLLALGGVAFLFSGTVNRLFSALIVGTTELVWTIPATVIDRWTFQCQPNGGSFAFQCAKPLLAELLQTGRSRLGSPIASVSGVDLAYLLLAVALWVLFSQLLSGDSKQSSDGPAAMTPRWLSALQSLPTRRPNLWAYLPLSLVAVFGLVLTASAIIAIPVISDAIPLDDKAIAAAEQNIDSLLSEAELARRLVPDFPLKDRFADLIVSRSDTNPAAPTTAVPKQPARDAQPGAAPVASPLPDAQDLVQAAVVGVSEQAKSLQTEATGLWTDLYDSVRRQFENTRVTARNLIARQNLALTNAQRKGGYIVDIRFWAETSRQSIIKRAEYCRNEIRNVEDRFHGDALTALSRVRSSSGTVGLDANFSSWNVLPSGLREFCLDNSSVREPEAMMEPVLGAFGFAGWLIRLGSIQLVLIVGMFGLGVIGSIISSRVSAAREQDTSPGRDLGRVLIRGASATLVVYLAMKGGLSIFAGGAAAPEPNPYVLLLSCFLASVYSDDVWVRFRDWFAGRRSRTQDETDTDTASAKS